jgi:hypothetical protein
MKSSICEAFRNPLTTTAMNTYPYEVQVLVNGRPVKEYLSKKDGKTYIEGRRGTDFTLRVCNTSSKRILVIPTIDGLSVMDGQKASYDSGGYIIDAYDNIIIPGWRLDDEKVAKFFFSDRKKSYAHKTGQGGNQGIIGVAIFNEKEPTYIKYVYKDTRSWQKQPKPVYPDPIPYPKSPIYGGCLRGQEGAVTIDCNCPQTGINVVSLSNFCSSSLGTGFGKEASHSVVTTTFDRKALPKEIFEIYYDNREGLREKGVFENLAKKIVPSAFPKETKNYCKPPKGWVR